jgi:iron-sulfur cluster assembly accessory protein
MIEITDAALAEIKQILKQENREGYGLRIYAAGISCSGIQYGLSLEKEKRENDTVFDAEDLSIYVDSELEEETDGFVIDFIDNEYGRGFIIENPNASPCGPSCDSCE